MKPVAAKSVADRLRRFMVIVIVMMMKMMIMMMVMKITDLKPVAVKSVTDRLRRLRNKSHSDPVLTTSIAFSMNMQTWKNCIWSSIFLIFLMC